MHGEHSHKKKSHTLKFPVLDEPIPGFPWEPPSALPSEWPAILGPETPADSPRPDLNLKWAAEKSANSRKNYDEYTTIDPKEYPIVDSDFAHDDEPDEDNPAGGWGRLKTYFEYTIHEVVRSLCAMDEAVLKQDAAGYAKARTDYLKMVRELNKPPIGSPPPKPYPTKWFYVIPSIRAKRIVGATVILQWNPHSSSSHVQK